MTVTLLLSCSLTKLTQHSATAGKTRYGFLELKVLSTKDSLQKKEFAKKKKSFEAKGLDLYVFRALKKESAVGETRSRFHNYRPLAVSLFPWG